MAEVRIALTSCNYRLSDCDDVLVSHLETFGFSSTENALSNQFRQVISLSENRASNSS